MGPLSGTRIVEIAGLGPGPFAAMMLADLGADVVRVDRAKRGSGGLDPRLDARPEAQITNRGRRSVAVDLKHDAGREIVLQLIDGADALIEGFRPGVMERLGLGPDEALRRNPRLVYGRMTGWGREGPLADTVGHDINYIAFAGALDNFRRVGGRPQPPLSLVGDYGGGGMLLAFGIACALVEVSRSGQGQVVDAAIIDGVAALQASVCSRIAQGQWHEPPGTNYLDGGAPWYDVFECADGKFVTVGALEAKFYSALLDTLGLDPDRWPQWDESCWPELRRHLTAAFKSATREEWCARFEGVETCFAPVLSLREAPQHPHAIARDVFIEREGVVQPAPAPRFSRTPATLGAVPSAPGAHTSEVLHELGFDDSAIERLRHEGTVA